MERLIEGFEHVPGEHCGSVAMADVLRHAGIGLSEPMVFGLGAGLHCFYIVSDHVSPSRQILGRSPDLEEQVAASLGLEFRAHRTADPDEGWALLREAIDAGKPPLVSCDLAELGYWNSKTPFNGHRVVAAGYDEDAGEVLLADTHFEGLQRVGLEEFAAARASQGPPMFDARHLFWTLESTEADPLDVAVERALGKAYDNMESSGAEFAGTAAIRAFADEVGSWVERPDAAWCYRFAYQVIERRGTGGGFFRRMYRDFLREAEEFAPEIATLQLGVAMARTAQAWSTLADYLEAMSRHLDEDAEDPGEDPAHHVESLAEAVYQFESSFWDRLGQLL